MWITCKLKKLIISLVAMVFICGFTSFASEATFVGYKSGDYGEFNNRISDLRYRSYVTEIKWSNTAPDSGVETVNVADDSGESILAWKDSSDNNIIWLYTEADKVYMPEDSTGFLRNFWTITNLDFLTNVDSSRVTKLNNAFRYMTGVTNLDGISSWNTSNVTDLSYAFYKTSGVTSLDAISSWNTSNVTDLSYAFYNLSKVTSLDSLSEWDTSKVTNLSYTFYGMSGVTSLEGLSDWDTQSVTTLFHTFESMSSVTNLDGLSNWNVSNVTDLQGAFYGMSGVTSLEGLSDWDTSKVTNLSYTFYGMSGVTSLEGLSDWNTQSVTTLFHTFESMSSVTNLDGLSNWNVSNVTDLQGAFYGMSGVTSLEGLSDWDTSKVTNLSYAFYKMSGVTSLDGLSKWNTSNVTDLSYTFCEMSKVTSLNGISTWDTSKVTNLGHTFHNMSGVTNLEGLSDWDTQSVTTLSHTFEYMKSVTNLDGLSNWTTSKVNTLYCTFGGMESVTSLAGISTWDTSNVTTLEATFSGMSSVTNLDGISTWDTSNVTTLEATFNGMKSVTNLDGLLNWDTSKVNKLYCTFEYMESATNLDGLLNWNTSKVTTLRFTFRGMSSVTNLDGLSNWNVSNVSDLDHTFCGMESVTNLDGLLNWNTSKVTYIEYTFYGMKKLKNTDGIQNWDLTKITHSSSGMFSGDTDIEDLNLASLNVHNAASYPFYSRKMDTRPANIKTFVPPTKLVVTENSFNEILSETSNLVSWIVDGSPDTTYTKAELYNLYKDNAQSNIDNGTNNTIKFIRISSEIIYNLDGGTKVDTDDKYPTTYNEDSIIKVGDIGTLSKEGYAFIGWSVNDSTEIKSNPDDILINGGTTSIILKANFAKSIVTLVYGLSDRLNKLIDRTTITNIVWTDTAPSEDVKTVYVDTDNILKAWADGTVVYIYRPSYMEEIHLPTSCFEFLEYMHNLQSLEFLSNVEATNLTNLTEMFADCSSLTTLNGIEHFDVSNVKYIPSIFSGCKNLVDTSAIGNWHFNDLSRDGSAYIFSGDKKIETLNLKGFKQITWSYIYSRSVGYSPTKITFPSRYIIDKDKFISIPPTGGWVLNGSVMSLDNIYDIYVETVNDNLANNTENAITIERVPSITYDFNGGTKVDTDDKYPTGYNKGSVIKVSDIGSVFKEGYKFLGWSVNDSTEIKSNPDDILINSRTDDVTLKANFVQSTATLVTKISDRLNGLIDRSTITNIVWTDTAPSEDVTTIYVDDANILKAWANGAVIYIYKPSYIEEVYLPANCSYWLSGMRSLQSLEFLSNVNTTYTTNLAGMFSTCESLTTLDGIENFNVLKVTDIRYLFYNCKNLADTSAIGNWHFNDFNVNIQSSYIFDYDTKIKILNLKGFKNISWYDMSYEANGYKPKEITFPSSCKLTARQFKSIPYTADGWILNDSMMTLDEIYPIHSATVDDNIANGTENAITIKKAPSITYNLNGGTKVDTNDKYPTAYTKDSIIKVSDIGSVSKEGYTFVGWSVNGSTEIKSNPDDILINGGTDDIKLKANFSKCPSITYDFNGGTKVDTNDKYPTHYDYGSTVTVSDIGSVSKEGYTFIGWSVNNSTEIKSNPDDILINSGTDNITLKANFAQSTTTLVTNLSDRLNDLIDESTITNIVWTDTAPSEDVTTVYVDTDNILKAWADETVIYICKPNYIEEVYLPADCSYFLSGMSSLQRLEFLSNVNTTNTTNLKCMFEDCSSLTTLEGIENFDVSNVTNIGYLFYNCKNLVDTSAIGNWHFNDIISNYSTSIFWSDKNIEILNLKGFKDIYWSDIYSSYNKYKPKEITFPSSYKLTAEQFKSIPYTTDGWVLNGSIMTLNEVYPIYSATVDANITNGTENAITIKKAPLITYYYYGGTKVDTDDKYPNAYIKNSTIKVSDIGKLSKEGYKFLGWSVNDSTEIKSNPDDILINNGTENVVLRAHFAKYPTITYNYNGGFKVDTNDKYPTIYTEDSIIKVGDIGKLSKEGYKFLGWSVNDSTEIKSNPDDILINGGTTDVTLKGDFEKYPTITYNLNGGVLADSTDKYPNLYTEDSIIKVSDIGSVYKEGYIFIGWSVNDSTEIKSNPDDILINGGKDDVTLKANFAQRFSITYNFNGGTRVANWDKYPTAYTKGSTIKVSDIGKLSKAGYKFLGWSVNGSTEIKSNPDDILINEGTENVTLNAQFEKYPSITYNFNGGLRTDRSSDYPAYYVPGSTITVSDIGGVSKSGCEFCGWLVTPGNGVAKVRDTDVIISPTTTGDVTLTATWSMDEATLSNSFVNKLGSLTRTLDTIEYIRWSDTAPDPRIYTINVDSDNKGYINAWASGNAVYLYSDADKIYLPSSCSRLFYGLYGLKDLEFLRNVDASRVHNLEETFSGLKNVESLEPIRNWDVSNVTNMNGTFSGMTGITSLEGLKNWNTSKVNSMQSTFEGLTGLTSIEGLKNWNTSKVNYMDGLFATVVNVTSLEPLRNWDISNVTSLSCAFVYMQSVTSLEPLRDWDASNVMVLDGVFAYMQSVTSLEPIKDWNTSKVTSMFSTFDSMTSVTSLEPLKDWNISKVTILDSTFNGMTNVTNLDGLEDWDVSNVASMFCTFAHMENLLSTDAIENWNLSNVDASGILGNDSKIRHLNLASIGASCDEYIFADNPDGGVDNSPANVITITLPATYLIDESLFYNNILNNVSSDTEWVVDGDNTDNTYTKAELYARYQDNVQSNIDNNTNNTIKFILLSSITADVDISKEVPAGTYGIYDEDKNLIAEIESDDDNIITTIINVVKKISDTFIYYIKQLTISDEDYNVDEEYHQFKIVATPNELENTLNTEVVGLDEIEFNNTHKVATPSQLDEETIEIEVDDIITETVDLDDNMSDTARTFNVLEFVYENHDEDYFSRSLKTKGDKDMYKYTFEDTKNLHIDLEENEDDSDYYDLSMYTDNNTDEINFNIPDEVQEELIDAGITDVKLTKINIKFNNSSVATGSEIPKDNSDDDKGNTGKSTPSELDKNTDDNTNSGKATPSEIDKNTDNNTGDNDNTGSNTGGKSDDNGNTGSKSNGSDTKSNKNTKKDKDKDTDNIPAYDGDWLDLNGKNKNAPVSKAGGARFKIYQSNAYVTNETRILPVHGRSGEYRTYHFDRDGKLLYGWFKDPYTHQWHYFGEDGAEAYGWQKINEKWYFFNDDMKSVNRGEMCSNCTIGGYRLGADGALIESKTVPKTF